jgi:nucleotide-binding universal stress UspA family protein
MQLESVVVATDLSEPAGAAAEWVARHFAPAARLVLVYVIDASHRHDLSSDRRSTGISIDHEYDLAARRLRDAVAALGAVRCAAEIRFGRPAEEIARASEEFRADLIAVGKHARKSGIFGRLGSTAEELVRRSHVPVLLVAEQSNAAPRTLLAAVNDSHVAPWVVQWARFLAERFAARTTALHVVGASVFTSVLADIEGSAETQEEDVPESIRRELLRTADDWLSRLAGHGADRHPLHVDVIFGDPAEEIIAAAARMDADMIVIGSRGMGRVGSAILGSVASGVLRLAPCPVLVIKEPVDEVVDANG